MNTVDAALKQFVEFRPRLDQAGADVVATLKDVLGAEGISVRLTSRVKEIDSYRAKVMLKDYADPWNDVTDKVGVRALVERAADVDLVHRIIKRSGCLPIIGVTDKRAELEVEQLGYSGLHLDLTAPARDGDLEKVGCELQIRTVAQDAWSVVSHKLLYKPPKKLSKKDQRAILRLGALVELFDEEVDRVTKKQRSASRAVGPRGRRSDLLSLVSMQYSRFASNEGYAELSRSTLVALQETIAEGERENYPQVLARYVDEHSETLASLYNDYGAGSELSTSSAYLLWSQPESIAILERLDNNHGHALLTAWRNAELPDAWLKPLADCSNASLDL